MPDVVVVISPPFKAKSPDEVISPVNVDVPSMTRFPFAETFPVFVTVKPVDPNPLPTFNASNDAVAALAFNVVPRRETVAFRIVAVPVVDPSETVVAAFPMLRVVAFALKMFAVPDVVVMSPPLTAISPAEVIFPLPPFTEKLVPVISFAPSAIAVTIDASDTSRAVVNPPPPDEEILSPIGNARSVSALSMSTNCDGSLVPVPSARTKTLPAVESSAVVTMNCESVAVFASVNAMSRLFVVLIVFPPTYAD